MEELAAAMALAGLRVAVFCFQFATRPDGNVVLFDFLDTLSCVGHYQITCTCD